MGLYEFRKANGLTQVQAAEIFGIGQSYWSKLELRERGISLKRFAAFAKIADDKGFSDFPTIGFFVGSRKL